MLLDAQAKGHEIGNHTRTHPHLDSLSHDEQLAELTEADRELRSGGIHPKSFCYPYGSPCPPGVVEEAGYEIGLALKKRVAIESDDRRALPRIIAAFSDTIPMLLYKIHVRPRLRRD